MKLADVDLCNLALDQIAQTNITSLNDGTDASAKCARSYNQTVRYVLRSGRWKSARVKLQLAQTANMFDPAVVATNGTQGNVGTPVGGWPPGANYTVITDPAGSLDEGPAYGDPQMAYPYQLPPDYLRLVRFNDVDSATTSYPFWAIRGNQIWSNQTQAFLEYVRDVTITGVQGSNPPSIGDLDSDLQEVIIKGLAARLAWIFQQSTKLQDQLKKEYDMMLARALAIDSRSERIALRSPYIDSGWIRARWISTAK